ncbi:GNAT family N-acetyltransferase [Streptomyces sp. bgisy153]|uniref:GNAT family N-acetyltransferase n=2 Tax=unclassified Streptomyces TaxID=2593676 RepID=UPI003D754911
MELTYRRFDPADATDVDALVGFLTSDTWPFHGQAVVDEEGTRQRVAGGDFDGDGTRTFWIGAGEEVLGLVRLMDLEDATPLFDLRLRSRDRGRGVGSRAVTWLTAYLFDTFPHVTRIEGTTRQDNVAMRRVFRACGYVKEAHYRQAWPTEDGTVCDAVGYAILRRDWRTGTTTLPDWDDEPLRVSRAQAARCRPAH